MSRIHAVKERGRLVRPNKSEALRPTAFVKQLTV